MNVSSNPEEKTVLLTIQNSNKPNQFIQLVYDSAKNEFVTEGLKGLFNVKEIRIESLEVLQSVQDYAQVLSFLLDTMSTAQDLNLQYSYQSEFTYQDAKYSLHEDGQYRVLKRIG
jgi:hypothetical protein